MSIVKLLPEVPPEGSVVYADGFLGDNHKPFMDRCVYENGVFEGGGEYPVRPYVLKDVWRWFDMPTYHKYQMEQERKCWDVSFEIAETIPEEQPK